MLHRVKEKKLGRDAPHRRAMIKNLSTSLVLNKEIVTTLAKAKYVRPFIEKLVTRAKKSQDFTAIKYAKTKLTTGEAVDKLFKEIVPLYTNRAGGYLRIVKLAERDGDKAQMARIEFVREAKKEVAKTESAKAKPETAKTEKKKTVAKPRKTAKKETKVEKVEEKTEE